jgi:ribonuclease HI
MKTIEVFTDGSCMRKKTGTLAGYGIHFPNNEIQDVSRKFTREPLTNQRAELFAIYVALILIKKVLDFDKVIIYSDSEYSIKCLTVWMDGWIKKSWMTATNKPVMNQDILKSLDSILQNFKNKIEFVHVMSHTKKTDYKSIGNAVADKLATEGALK